MNTRSLFLSLLTLGWITSSYALELPTGARPMGLAAFSAIADDANAVKWNPAGLTQLSRQELTTMWTELFKSGFTQSHLGYALPITNKLAIGADWTAIQFDDAELAYRQDRVHLAGAYRPFSGFSFGFNIKSLFSSTQVDQISEGDTRRFDGDIGVLFRPHSEIQLAFVLRDVANTGVTHEYQNQISREEISARRGIVGIAYQTPLPSLTLSAETDVQLNDRLRVGGEYQFRNLPSGVQAALRAGLHKEWDTGERPAWAVGGSLGLSVSSYADVLFEYAYLDSPSLPGTHRFALRIPFDFNPKLVEIEKIEFPQADYMVSEVDSPVFISSLLPYHEKTHLATISLRNKRDKILAVSVKFTLPDYLKGTVVASDIALLPKSTVRTDRERKASAAPPEKVEIRALLPTEILTLKSSKNLTATIKVDYSGVERYTPVETSFSLTFIKPGLVPVNKGVQAFIPFIDPNDPIVQGFAQRIIAEYAQDGLRKTLLPSIEASEQSLFFLDKWRPLLNMMQIYESLRQFKVRYVPDAQSPYWARDNQSFDSVKYPGEFLTSAEKAGDCDDVSVLIAALCESVDVRTALVEVPGHVFVFVNTGLYSADTEGGYVSQCGILALPEERFVRVSGTGDPNWDHHLVIPLDASQQIDDTFIEAWEKGLKTYRANQGLAKLFIVRREHKNYPPVHPPQAPKSPPKIEDFKPIDDRIKRDMQTIIQWQQEHKSHLQAEVAGNFPDEMISLLLNRAKEQAQRGETDEAKETLRQADEIDKADKFTAIENNLGNIARIEGNFEEALIKYQHAHERAPDDAGILLNLALTHLGLGEKEAADKLLWRWKQKGGNIPEAARLLWVMPEPTSEVRGESVILERKLHALLETVKRAESVEDLRGEHLEFLKDEFLNPNSGMYWEAYKAR